MGWEPCALEKISVADIQSVESFSPAFKKYRRILNEAPTESSPAIQLKLLRLRQWCQTVAASYLKQGSPEEVCLFWSNSASEILKQAWQLFELQNADLGLFALGKLGSQELNLSSDVDLLIVSEAPVSPQVEAQVKEWIRFLSQTDQYGFLFRVDVDLRPGGRFAPLIPNLRQLEDHYWGLGETWERLALIRLRQIAGPQEFSNSLYAIRKAFSFRKYLDYSLLSDFKSLRQDIFNHSLTVSTKAHLKLMPGGIRDIELLIHSLQIIHGGRVKQLQTHRLSEAMRVLEELKFVSSDDISFLHSHYWHLRDLENQVQAKEDRQTHSVAKADVDSFIGDFERAQNIIDNMIGGPNEVQGIPTSHEEQMAWLKSLGFDLTNAEVPWKKIVGTSILSRRAGALRGHKNTVLREFIENIAEGLNPDLGLVYFADFIQASRAKSSLFTVLSQSPTLVRDLSQLFSSSSYAANLVSSRLELIDTLFLQKTSESPDDDHELIENLLDRKFMSQVSLGLDFMKRMDAESTTRDLSVLADQLVSELLGHLKKQEGGDLDILKLGKWGRRELSFKSDLDFVFVCSGKIDGSASRLAKRFVSRLTEAHRGGSLYGIDLRLRPNGAAGPLLVTRESLLEFLKTKADAWQRQSYYLTHFSESEFTLKLQETIMSVAWSAEDLRQLLEIRKQLWKKQGPNDLKYSPGGLVDIEFATQIACVQNQVTGDFHSTSQALRNLTTVVPKWSAGGAELLSNYLFLRKSELVMQFILNRAATALRQDAFETSKLHKLLGGDWKAFTDNLRFRFERNTAILKDLDPVLSAE